MGPCRKSAALARDPLSAKNRQTDMLVTLYGPAQFYVIRRHSFLCDKPSKRYEFNLYDLPAQFFSCSNKPPCNFPR